MKATIDRVRAHCLAKEGATEDEPWPDDKAWKVRGKIFAMWGGDAITVKSTPDKQSALIQHPNISVAAYVGRFGWVRIDPKDKATLDLALDLIDESYEMITAKKAKSTKR
ncbi:MAG: hypothetical protein QOJ65_766 [Fimbriimonadaceae bacterium]|nr:hypothetical protein [Fimbriimonadaceae bacterium]